MFSSQCELEVMRSLAGPAPQKKPAKPSNSEPEVTSLTPRGGSRSRQALRDPLDPFHFRHCSHGDQRPAPG